MHIRASTQGHAIGLPVIWTHEQLLQHQRDFIASVYADVAATSPKASIILDKTPDYVFHVDHIIQLVPDTHFIHIIRDGRDVVTSRLAAQATWWTNWQQDVTQVARKWAKSVEAGRNAARYAGQYTEVRYEDLRADGITHLKRIFADIGIEITQERAQQIYDEHQFDKMKAKYTQGATETEHHTKGIFKAPEAFYRKGAVMGWKQDLNTVQRYRVYQQAQKQLLKFNYVENAHWWHDLRIVRWFLPVGIACWSLLVELATPIRKRLHLQER